MQEFNMQPLENGFPRSTQQGALALARHARALAGREGSKGFCRVARQTRNRNFVFVFICMILEPDYI
ncbi:hypothetical protein HanIR_Chr05g0224141 [Helianthus annuus]|nr:hypothetical protein HanIR_Chr05g0224141 [Helianthus annuus]